MIDPISGFIIEEETVRSNSAHGIPNPSTEKLFIQAAHSGIGLVNSSDGDGLVTEESDGVSKDSKRVWSDADKQEWLKIYNKYMHERLKTLPQPVDIRGTLGKDIIVGRGGVKRAAGRSRRKLKQGGLEEDKTKEMECDVSDLHKDYEMNLDKDSLEIDIYKKKSTSETTKLLNMRYNSLRILKYSNICLFKLTKQYVVCYVCREWFKDMQTLRDHAKDSHTYEQIRKKIVKENDMFLNADITDLECKMCSVVLNTLSEFENHLTTHSVKLKTAGSSLMAYKLCTNIIVCQICRDIFMTYDHLQKHTGKHFPNYKLQRKSYRAHIKSAHKISGITLKYDKHGTKLKERKIAPDKNRFKCDQCSQKFRYDYKRTRHMIEEHEQESKLFQCQFCPKVFMTVHWLTKHMNCVHQKELYS